MELPILIEQLPGRDDFVARLGDPFNLTAEAPTADEAQRRLVDALSRRLQTGAELRALVVPPLPRPGGWLPDDELTQEWRREVEAYRAECDAADRARLSSDPGPHKAAS